MAYGTHRPRATLGRQLRVAGGLLLVLLVLAAGLYGLWWFLVGQPVLAGERSIDFGAVEFAGQPVTLQHTFVLTNRRRRPVEIRDVRTTCGCAAAEPGAARLEPGGSVEIAATLTLRQEGIKEARIILLYGDGSERDVLHLRGAARVQQRLRAAPGPARLEPGGRLERLLFWLDYDGNDPPPAPRITAPDGIRAEFTRWTQMARRRQAKGLPARWRGEVRLDLAGAAPPEPAAVVVEVGADQRAEIPLTFE